MPLEQIINFLNPASFSFIAKLFVLFLFVLYNIFAFIVIRQVDLMGKTVKLSLTSFLKLLSFLHFLASLGLTLLSLIIL